MGSEKLTLSAEDFPVKISAQHGMAQVLPEHEVDCGLSSPDSSESYDQSGSSSKTLQISENVDLTSCFKTLPAWGSMRIGRSSQHRLLAHRINVIDCGLSPTENGNLLFSAITALTRTQDMNPSARIAGEILANVIASGRLQQRTPDGNVSKRIGALLPTPTVQDGENNAGPAQYCRNTYPLNVIAGTNMNPQWVEWLMGFPTDHTVCRS